MKKTLKAETQSDNGVTVAYITNYDDKIEDVVSKNIEGLEKKMRTSQKNLEKRIETQQDNIFGFLAANYLSVDQLAKRDYLLRTKFVGTIKNKKIKKEMLEFCKLYQQRVIDYDQTAILLVHKMLKEEEDKDVLVRRYI